MNAKVWTCFVEFPGELNQKCGKTGLLWEAMKKAENGQNGRDGARKHMCSPNTIITSQPYNSTT